MSSQKTNKAAAKRLKITKNGKVKSRRPGRNHYNAKESGRKKLNKRSQKEVDITKPQLREALPHHDV